MEDKKSKSQLKREMTALQELGEKLVQLSQQQLQQVPLPENLLAAVKAARKITAHGGKRRQLQYIGKLMRMVDPAPILDALTIFENQHAQTNAQLHESEQWRERLLTEGKSAVTELCQAFPNVDTQLLRHLLKNASLERDSGKPPGAGRALFRFLRDLQKNK